ncbi:MAG: HAD family hydrolase [Candidatus Heimdallarchaeota archaeon]|nr:HAD family hydrolase [Candidatus Heimdallarchaeota archaeon]
MFEAVLFDADETIFNNEGIHMLVTSEILQSLKMSLSLTNEIHDKWDMYYFQEQKRLVEEVGYCIDRENAARSLVLALKDHGKEITIEEADEFYNFMIEKYTTISKPYPDVLKLINLLKEKEIKMAIVSNGNYEIIMSRLQKANIENLFEFVIAPCSDYPLTKPDIKIFQTTLAKIKTPAKKAMFIGDNPYADIEGANKAGLYTVLIDRRAIFNGLKGFQIPNKKISSFEEIISLFS